MIGARLIGRRHVALVVAEPGATLAAIVDPSEAGTALAAAHGVPWFADMDALLHTGAPEAVIIATPNQLHATQGMQAVANGVAMLVEKPIADDSTAAAALVAAAEQVDVPLLVGHHRRHNPLGDAAKQAIEAGRVGRIVAVYGHFWLVKPADYFAPDWRRQKGAGPVFLNLIHDVDLLRHLCGEVTEVQAMESNALRGNDVEETAVILLRFASGALGTVTVSDTVAAPWSWELTSGENPAYARTAESCYLIGGTNGSLTVPQLDLWSHEGGPHWHHSIEHERLPAEATDPLALQVRNLCAMVRGTAAPVVPGHEGLATLRVIEAVKQAAASGTKVRL